MDEKPCTPAMIWFGFESDCIIREFCIDLQTQGMVKLRRWVAGFLGLRL